MAQSAPLRDRRDGNRNVVLLLSLKLILLAFFILLNALSEFESRKTSAVLESVNHAFRGSIKTPKDANSVSASLGVLPLPDDMINEIGSLFESFVPSARARRTSRATVMTIEMPASALFRPGEDDIRPERKILIRRVARALMRDPGGVTKYELAFEHGTPPAGTPAAEDPDPVGEPTARAVRRADAVARYLIRQAIPEAVLSIGLRPDMPETVRFILRVRAEEEPAGEGVGVPARSGS